MHIDCIVQDNHEYENKNNLIVEIVSGVCLQKVGKSHISIQAATSLENMRGWADR